jgi:hypothetical protein
MEQQVRLPAADAAEKSKGSPYYPINDSNNNFTLHVFLEMLHVLVTDQKKFRSLDRQVFVFFPGFWLPVLVKSFNQFFITFSA